MTDLAQAAQKIAVWALPLIFAITLHEAAHGYAALALGDDTAKRAGRLSINPLRHVDPVGTILLPAVMLLLGGFVIGWAKPVPVDFSRLKGKRLGMVAVAAAGPATNIVLAVGAALAAHALPVMPVAGREWFFLNLQNALYFNILLAVFNMIPIPPLDGGRVAVGLLPLRLAIAWAKLERFGMIIVLAGLFILPMLGHSIGVPLDIFVWMVAAPVTWIAGGIVTVFGP